MDINISTATRGKLHAPHIVPRWELIPRILLNSKTNFKQASEEEPSLTNSYVRGTLNFLPQLEWIPRFLTRNKVGFIWSGLNAGSCCISKDQGMSESCVETVEKAIVLRLIWIGGITSLWYLERHTEFKASKGDDAWLFSKIDRNPNISVETRKGPLVCHLTSRSVCIILPSLV